jgi:hypothetical protein
MQFLKKNIEIFKVYVKDVYLDYDNLIYLKKYLNKNAEKFEISNYGNIKFDGKSLKPSLVKDGKHKGFCKGMWDNYMEIIIPGIYIPYWIFLVHRLVAEGWCENPNKEIYTDVHHIGNGLRNNSENLMFVTQKQHGLIHPEMK